MIRSKFWLIVAIVTLVSVMAWAAVPTGFTLATSSTTDSTGCVQSTSSGMCLVAPTSTTVQVWVWASNGPMVEIYPATGTAPVASVFGRTGAITAASGDYSFSQLSSPPTQLAITCPQVAIGTNGLSVPTASPCTITVLK